MPESVGMILTLLMNIVLFGVANYFAVKHSARNIKRRIIAGLVFLLFTPVIFFSSLYLGFTWDDSGWGAGILTVIYTGLYILNGLILLLSSIHIYFRK
jgi:heme/copper-type cytochrome/quinol oxidase subunit 3